ncbi:MAG: hypothetical protein K5989_01810 [Lachnospiraceae bacterium]|nr:hypothetical protein [Lachnospiraceae bacterium]
MDDYMDKLIDRVKALGESSTDGDLVFDSKRPDFDKSLSEKPGGGFSDPDLSGESANGQGRGSSEIAFKEVTPEDMKKGTFERGASSLQSSGKTAFLDMPTERISGGDGLGVSDLQDSVAKASPQGGADSGKSPGAAFFVGRSPGTASVAESPSSAESPSDRKGVRDSSEGLDGKEGLAAIASLKETLSQQVHQENVRCYRNSQAVINDSEKKIREELQAKYKSLKRILIFFLFLGILNLAAIIYLILHLCFNL